jgi:hypothetical protein
MNQELSLPTNGAMIEDGLNDILVVFSIDRRQFRRNPPWE